MRTGAGELLAELRPAYSGVPALRRHRLRRDDADAIEKLDAFVRRAQTIMAGYGGNVLQLTLGDKGAYLYGVVRVAGRPRGRRRPGRRRRRSSCATSTRRPTPATSRSASPTAGCGAARYGHAMRRTLRLPAATR